MVAGTTGTSGGGLLDPDYNPVNLYQAFSSLRPKAVQTIAYPGYSAPGIIEAIPGKEITVVILGRTTTGGFDPVLRIYGKPVGSSAHSPSTPWTQVGFNDDGYDSLGNSIVRFTPEAGIDYTAVITPYSSTTATQSYYFEVSTDSAGNSFGSARDIGSLNLSSKSFDDFVGYGDASDFYRFTLDRRSTVNLSLSGMYGNADLLLADSGGSTLRTSTNARNTSETITETLNPGTYYVKVSAPLVGTVTSIPSSTNATSYSVSFSATAIAPARRTEGDVNNDGRSDLVWRNYASGENVVWLMNGTTITQGSLIPTVADRNWSIAGTGDFNNDGRSDLVWRNYATGSNVVWYMNGASVIGADSLPTVADLNWSIAGTGDFNNDGRSDLVWRNYASGDNVVWYMNGTAFSGANLLPSLPNLNWSIAGTGDFNNDGQSDLVWRNYASGENVIWLMNGATFSRGVSLPAVPDTTWSIAGTGDFNNDGQSDLIWRNGASGGNVLWLMNSTAVAQGIQLTTSIPDPNWRIGNAYPGNPTAFPGRR